MKFLVKEISNSRKEIRVTLSPSEINGISTYIFGSIGKTFDEGTMGSNYIPTESSMFNSVGPNPGIIRLIVAYLKDKLGNPIGFNNTSLRLGNGIMVTIVNIAVDDINLSNITSNTLPSMVIKLTEPLSADVSKFDEVYIERHIINTQEQDVYYISEDEPPAVFVGLAHDESMVEEIGNTDLQNLSTQNLNELTGSFKHSDSSLIDNIISESHTNLKIDYNDFKNHTHFGSAVSKVENFKYKVSQIQDNLVQISQSLATGSLDSANTIRKSLFDKIRDIKNTFTPYENHLYYKSDMLKYKYKINIGPNYTSTNPLDTRNAKALVNESGFPLVYEASGSNAGTGYINLFRGKYNVEDKPFYNHSGSFYLSFLMRGDESINTPGFSWDNNQEENKPKLPHDSLYTSSILQPTLTSESWHRYIFLASSSYWAPYSVNPIIGSGGSITDFEIGSGEVTMLHNTEKSGSYPITVGGRYTNLATTVTSSGVSFTGSISPAGELFDIYIDTSISSNITSSYLTDIKITKNDPSNVLPFSDVYSTGSSEFINWYDEQHSSASQFDVENYHSLQKTLPDYFDNDDQIDNSELRKFINLMGEEFDLIKNYIDGYGDILKTQYGEVGNVPDNLLPLVAQNYNWNFMLPFGKKEDADAFNFYGASVSNINNTSNVKNNIWRNIVNNIKYIYKTKGTHNSIRALLNSYGFPPDILKIREHGASMDNFEDGVLSDNVSNLTDGIGGTTGNQSFTQKEDQLIGYNIDRPDRTIRAKWRNSNVNANAVEFIFKPAKGTNRQIILESSGSSTGSLWDVILERSSSDDAQSRLTFRLNNTPYGSESLDRGDRSLLANITMSTDYHNFKNQNYWNVLLQRTSGSDPAYKTIIPLHTVSQSYELYIGEQQGDKIKVLEAVSMSFGGNDYSHSSANWVGTGSSEFERSSSNLVIGETMTGSIAEFRTWRYALSASKFKQHILDKKSVVGNTITASRDELIYHYRLNENWPASGSENPKFKDYNPSTIDDFSIPFTDTLTGSLASGSMYDLDVFERIQFNVGIGGSMQLSDNNIIIDNERRFINNLDPFEPSMMSVYHPLINKRKASSTLEITRSPQEVINDFILNQLGNFDFNDKFADPRDINKDNYDDLEDFAKDFFDYYDISLDVNKFINAQAAIFTKELINSIKRLAPARAQFSKVGVELKPTLLERQKLPPATIEKEILNFEGGIEYNDWEKNIWSKKKLHTLYPANLTYDANIEFYSHTGSKYYDFTNQYEVYETKDGDLELASATGSSQGYYDYTNQYELHKSKNADLELASATGSSQGYYDFTNEYELYKTKDAYIEIASATGSVPTITQHHVPNKDGHVELASPTGSSQGYYDYTDQYEVYDYKNLDFDVASSTGSITWKFDELQNLYSTKDGHIEIASHTGSNPGLIKEYIPNKDIDFDVASSTGSITWKFDDSIPLYKTRDKIFNVASSTGSIAWNFDNLQPLYSTKDTHIEIASATGSVPGLSQEYVRNKQSDIVVASHTGSLYNFSNYEPLYENREGELDISVEHDNDLSSVKRISYTSKEHNMHDFDIEIASVTASNPIINQDLFQPYIGEFKFIANENLGNVLGKSYEHFDKDWGNNYSDVWFIHYGYPGSGSNYNTYHYEKRYIYHIWGDVENISGSNSSLSSSFSSDFTGDFVNSIHTSSKDFSNQTFIKTNDFMGLRPLGTTMEFKPTGSISFKGGKFLDETYVYPANHTFLVGTTKNSIDRLMYKGTQNIGNERLESEAYDDLQEKAFYRILNTGATGYTVTSD